MNVCLQEEVIRESARFSLFSVISCFPFFRKAPVPHYSIMSRHSWVSPRLVNSVVILGCTNLLFGIAPHRHLLKDKSINLEDPGYQLNTSTLNKVAAVGDGYGLLCYDGHCF